MAIRIGIAGYGYWGPNLVRNFTVAHDSTVVMVSDLAAHRLDACRRQYPHVQTTTDFDAMLGAVDAVVISTPVRTHFDLALRALRANRHVLIEKPMTDSSEDAVRLVDEAARRQLVLMVDHTFVYSAAVRKIRQLIQEDTLGHVYYYDSIRVNLGLFQRDVNVVWDLAVHDVSILDHIWDEKPCAISANGVCHVPGSPENMAYLTLYFRGNTMAHVNVNWLAPVKVRRTLIGGSRKMIVYDDLEPSEKIKVYDRGVTVADDPEQIYQLLIGYRAGDMWAPQLETREALRDAAEHFIRCVEAGATPTTDGLAGLRVVELLEAATRSMRLRGHPVELGRLRSAS